MYMYKVPQVQVDVHCGVCVYVQVAEENGLEVLDQLSANPVSAREPTAVGINTLSTAEEDQLSRRY